MPNIFGTKDEFLTNPLTSDLLADGFNALNFSEVHTDELHDNTGTGKIIVHEEFNMTNKKITNMADPVAGKDAVTLDYYESNLPVIPSVVHPYDMEMVFTDNTTVIPLGNLTPEYYTPRAFDGTQAKAFLRTPPSIQQTFRVYLGSIIIAELTFGAGNSVSTTQNPWLNTSSALQYERIFVENISATQDTACRGLLVILNGNT